MKNLGRVGAVLLAGLTVGSLVGCGGNGGNNNGIDPSKTQLYVANYDGGFGHAWLENVKAAFEYEMKDRSFEADKKGVEIIITNQKDEINNYTLFERMSTYTYDVYYTGQPVRELYNNNMIVDMTELAKEPIGFGETKSIWDKMLPYYKENGYTTGDKIYWFPHAESVFGVSVYDVKLFEEKGYFISKDSTKGNVKFTGTGEKSLGIDGIEGTYDDGCPATTEEFKALLNKIKGTNVTPYTWAGMYPAYTEAFIKNYDLMYDDAASWKAYDYLSGTIETVDYGQVEINENNGYLVANRKGALEALELADYLMSPSTNFYSGNAFKSTQTHIKAQNEFLTSVNKDTRIAMMIEGSWWENEALAMFDEMGSRNPEHAFKTRAFGIMPVPRPDNAVATGNTASFETSCMTTFIASSTTQLDLAKEFVKYLYTDEALKEFNLTAGSTCAYEYSLTDEEKSSLSYFSQRVYELMHAEQTNKVLSLIHSQLYQDKMSDYPLYFTSNCVGGGTNKVSYSTTTLYDNADITARQYFDGMSNYWKLIWDTKLKPQN